MDLNKKYDYAGEMQFINNNCNEVTLTATNALDMSAVVRDVSTTIDYTSFGINQLYKAYEVYNFGGDITINTTALLPEDSNIQVKIFEGAFFDSNLGKLKNASYKIDGNNLKINYDFETDKTYYILITDKVTFASSLKADTNVDNDSGVALEMMLPIIGNITKFKQGCLFYYSEMSNDDETYAFRDNYMNYLNNYLFSSYDTPILSVENKNVKAISKKDITKKIKFLRKYLGMFETQDKNVKHWYELLFTYTVYDYSNGTIIASNGIHGDNGDKTDRNYYNNYHTNFEQYTDEFCFQNFESDFGPTGNCLGIAHFISYLYNNRSYPANGSYGDIAWDLTTDQENATLLNPGVFDYKDIHFVDNRSGRNDDFLARDVLSSGEYEFVKMIGAAFLEGNDRIDHDSHIKINGELNNYSTLQQVMNYLDQGKVANICLTLNNGTGHAITVYDYYWVDDEHINFRVYDSNIPQNDRENYYINADGASYLQCKVVTRPDGSQAFQYLYYPLENNTDYMASSYYYLMQTHCFIAVDENWNEFI